MNHADFKLHGRRKIFVTKPDVINEDTIKKAIGKVIPVFNKNSDECDYLWNYFKGKQPILTRLKKFRPEINNKIVINHAYEIATFKIGYVYGDPIQYVQKGIAGIKEGYSDVNNVAVLNELMEDDDKSSKDKELGEWQQVCGSAYRMVLPTPLGSDEIFMTDILDPRLTFVVYDTRFGKKPWLCATCFFKEVKGAVVTYLEGYTEHTHFKIEHFNGITRNYWSEQTTYGFLPIIEYPANMARLGCFEPVMHLMNAVNLAESNRMDAVEQFIQYYVKFVNVDIDDKDFDKFREKGFIKVKTGNNQRGDVDVITVELNQLQMQSYVDSLYQKMLQISGIPDRNASAGGNTGQALIIGQGWANTEARAKDTELMFKKSEKQFLRAIIRIMKDTSNTPDELKSLTIKDIDIKPSRNKTDNLLVKTQSLVSMLTSGVHPRIAFQICGIFGDPEQAYVDSQPYLNEKWLNDLKGKVENKKIEDEGDIIPKLPVTG